jgi:hypothetical protein
MRLGGGGLPPRSTLKRPSWSFPVIKASLVLFSEKLALALGLFSQPLLEALLLIATSLGLPLVVLADFPELAPVTMACVGDSPGVASLPRRGLEASELTIM